MTFAALADPTRRAMLAQLGQGERSVGELAAPFAMSFAGAAKHLGVLERAGLVERRPDPNDRRGKLIALTAGGKRIVDETITRHVANEEHLLAVLTTAEQEKLNALLKKLIAGL